MEGRYKYTIKQITDPSFVNPETLTLVYEEAIEDVPTKKYLAKCIKKMPGHILEELRFHDKESWTMYYSDKMITVCKNIGRIRKQGTIDSRVVLERLDSLGYWEELENPFTELEIPDSANSSENEYTVIDSHVIPEVEESEPESTPLPPSNPGGGEGMVSLQVMVSDAVNGWKGQAKLLEELWNSEKKQKEEALAKIKELMDENYSLKKSSSHSHNRDSIPAEGHNKNRDYPSSAQNLS